MIRKHVDASMLRTSKTWPMFVWVVRGVTEVFVAVAFGFVANVLADWRLVRGRRKVLLVVFMSIFGLVSLGGAAFAFDQRQKANRSAALKGTPALTLTPTAYVEGITGASRPTFDRFTGVPNIDDERDFVHVKIDGAAGGFSNNLHVDPGDVVLARVYVHNNADSSLNDGAGPGIARSVFVSLRTDPSAAYGQSVDLLGTIHSTNASPATISDRAVLYSSRSFLLRPIEGSVEETDNSGTRVLPDTVVSTSAGSSLGDIPGCFANVRLVTAKFVVTPK